MVLDTPLSIFFLETSHIKDLFELLVQLLKYLPENEAIRVASLKGSLEFNMRFRSPYTVMLLPTHR